jgi:hypothetical protein
MLIRNFMLCAADNDHGIGSVEGVVRLWLPSLLLLLLRPLRWWSRGPLAPHSVSLLQVTRGPYLRLHGALLLLRIPLLLLVPVSTTTSTTTTTSSRTDYSNNDTCAISVVTQH